MATQAQIRANRWHRQVATQLGFGRSTILHRSLQGTLSAPSPTGVVVLTPQGSQSGDETPLTSILVWAIWQQKMLRTTPDDDLEPGKTLYEIYAGQCPTIDWQGNPVTLADEDWLQDNETIPHRYKIQNPAIDPSLSFWIFEMERLR